MNVISRTIMVLVAWIIYTSHFGGSYLAAGVFLVAGILFQLSGGRH